MERFRFHSDGGGLFFVTFSVVEWLPVFVSEAACRLLTDNLNFCHEHKGLRTNAYVVMPTHFHGIFYHASFAADELKNILHEFRKFTGHKLADLCDRSFPSSFRDTLRDHAGADRERRFWQATQHPERIETEPFWQTKFDYLHANPVRKGLVRQASHWRFSSAAYWQSECKAPTDVILSSVA